MGTGKDTGNWCRGVEVGWGKGKAGMWQLTGDSWEEDRLVYRFLEDGS